MIRLKKLNRHKKIILSKRVGKIRPATEMRISTLAENDTKNPFTVTN